MANPNEETKVVTGKVRLSYAHLFEPWAASPKDDPKYSVRILIPKGDKETLAKIKRAIKAAAENGKNSKFGGSIPKPLQHTLRDGDKDDSTDKNPEQAGHYFMNVSATTKPGVVDAALNPIMDSTEVYSGCYARVSMNAFPYNTNGNKGVSFGLNHVMKVADGEPMGGRSRAEDDFAEFRGEAADEDSEDIALDGADDGEDSII